MLRFLVLLLLLLLVWRGTMLLLERAGVGRRQVRGGGPPGAATGEELVRCAVCSTRVPASRALTAGGRWVCSPTCRDAAGGLAD